MTPLAEMCLVNVLGVCLEHFFAIMCDLCVMYGKSIHHMHMVQVNIQTPSHNVSKNRSNKLAMERLNGSRTFGPLVHLSLTEAPVVTVRVNTHEIVSVSEKG